MALQMELDMQKSFPSVTIYLDIVSRKLIVWLTNNEIQIGNQQSWNKVE